MKQRIVRRACVAATCLAAGLVACVEQPKRMAPVEPGKEAKLPPKVLQHLDADGNGLYDDTERKAVLDVLRAACPELASEVFDADGDGKVSIREQEEGRHPLSQRVPKRYVQADEKIPWAIDLFPEWIMSGYFQEDVGVGPIMEQPVRGTIALKPTQEQPSLQPCKAEARGGVAIAANTGQHLTIPGHRDARWSYRWCLFTFRIDGASGTGDETVLLDINQGSGPSKSSPRIAYSRTNGLKLQYVGRKKGGLDRRVMTSQAVVADGKTWNVVVCGIRQGRLFASVNGVPLATAEAQPGRFSSDMAYDATSFVGGPKADNMAWAYDAIVLGQTELSEATVAKLSGWAAHRLGFQANLPPDHAYRDIRPVLDAEDLPHRYVHDNEKWTAWGLGIKDKTVTRANAGGPRVEPIGFERVFFDDFRAYRIAPSTSGEGDLWMGFGFNTAVGGDAQLVEPGKEPDVYPHDPVEQLQTLSLAKQGNRWRGSGIYSVNDMGQGYTWSGPKVFRIRCMFPKVAQKELGGGLFPAFWSYGTEFLFWRTSNRIECDWFEFDGVNGRWYNGLSTHYHYAHVKNLFVKQNESYQRYKLYSGELTEEKSKIPGGVFVWDGQFHTWEFVIDADMIYVNVTISGGDGTDRWVEVCRGPTAPTYLEPLDLQLDYALKAKQGLPPTDARQDFVVDWIEVLQTTAAVESLAEPFAARPVLEGDPAVGGTLRCRTNTPGVTDLRYYWFADGYPLTYGAEDAIPLTTAQAGTAVRCMVKAVGARDQPEAWSGTVRVVP